MRVPTWRSERISTVGAFGAGVVTTAVVVWVVVTVVWVTTALVFEAAVAWSVAVWALTSTRRRWSSAAQRCHCRWNDDGVGVQVPSLTDSVSPTTADPEIVGLTVFVGPFLDATTSLASEVADALPSAFVAVTTTRTV